MENLYITIEREFGSRGTDIAKQLSENLNMECYGFEILEQTAKCCSISVNRIEEYEERITKEHLEDNGDLNAEIQETICKLAKNGASVFVGHCASQALNDFGNVIKVFIKSDEFSKKENMTKHYYINSNAADEISHRYNNKRMNYYEINTDTSWTDYSNYDIVLDSGELGISGCVDKLSEFILTKIEN